MSSQHWYLGSLSVAIMCLGTVGLALAADARDVFDGVRGSPGLGTQSGADSPEETCGLTALLDYAALYAVPVPEARRRTDAPYWGWGSIDDDQQAQVQGSSHGLRRRLRGPL